MIWPFYVCAAMALWATLRMVTHANPVHGLLNLIVSLLAVAGMFFCMGAPFAGALEIIVYAGAILVLFVFVVMMLNMGSQVAEQEKRWLNSKAIASPALMCVLMVLALVPMLEYQNHYLLAHRVAMPNMTGQIVSAKQVGITLYGPYLLLVELASMLLLAALVAAYHLGKKPIDELNSPVRGEK